MTREYLVVRAVKGDGMEKGPGEVVLLESEQATALLGVFVEEAPPAPSAPPPALPASSPSSVVDELVPVPPAAKVPAAKVPANVPANVPVPPVPPVKKPKV